MKRAVWVVSLLFLSILVSATPSAGQAIYGEITGTVSDSSGAAIPQATVTATCNTTKASRTVVTGEAGGYHLVALPPCSYSVTVVATGFKTALTTEQVEVGITIKEDFALQVGQKSETVTVEAATPLVDYSEGINNEVDTKAIVDLPTEGRDFKSILALTPGVQRSPGGGFLDVSVSGQRTTTNNYMIDGMPNNDRFYGSEVVGQPGVLGIPASVLGNDSISEYTVQQLPSAENGVKGGAAINVTLKSGTNNFHGTAFYFGDYDWLNANNFFSADRTAYHNHNYGGTVGGPIIKDRTFFFFTFEGQRNKALEPYTVTIPTTGDLAQALADANDPAINPTGLPLNSAGLAMLKYYPCSNGAGAVVSCTPAAANAAVPQGGFTQTVASPNTDAMSSFIIKIDHKMNEKMQISGRYMYADSTQVAPLGGYTLPPAPGSGLPADAFNTLAPTRVQLAGATWTYNISPNKILDVRFNWSRYAQILTPNNKVNPLSLGIDTGPLNPSDFGVPPVYASSVTLGNPGGIQGYPLSTRPTQTYDLSVHQTWIHGKHTLRFGGNYQYASTFSLRNRARTGIFSDAEDFETLIDQFLTGRFDEVSRSFGDTSRHLYQPSLGMYVQDEWKVTPRVTVSYGLRWDINGALGDGDKNASQFFPCSGQEPNNCAPNGVPNGLVRVGQGISRLYNLDLHDFGPRAGIAWDVFGNGKTALRAGYAMTYDVANFSAISAPYVFQGARAGAFTNSDLGVFSVTGLGSAGQQFLNGNIDGATFIQSLFEPFTPDTCYNPGTNTGAVNPITGAGGPDFACIGPQPGTGTTPVQTFGANPTGTPPFNIFGTVPTLRTPRIQYYNLTIQHELFKNNVLTVSYIGSHGTDMFLNRSLNNRPIGCFVNGAQIDTVAGTPPNPITGDPGNPTNLNCTRPFDSVFTTNGVPTYNYVIQLTNGGYSRYNAMQVTYRQRDWHGLNTIANFTWSNCIDTNSVNRGGGSTLPVEENPFVAGANEGPCDTDVRLNFNTGVTYDVPRWSAAGRFGEGWEIGSIVTALTGRPYTVLVSSTADNSGQDLVYQRPDCIGQPKYQFSNPNIPTITNVPDVFAIPADGTIGTCGRNAFRGPHFVQWDANLMKTTKITERVSLQIRFEAFNLLNHPNFTNPSSTTISQGRIDNFNPQSSSFSTITQTPDIAAGNPFLSQGGPRAMQIGAKLIF
jgi:Carboxypeptidase regulatory-like domain